MSERRSGMDGAAEAARVEGGKGRGVSSLYRDPTVTVTRVDSGEGMKCPRIDVPVDSERPS
eukprot:16535-Rhodomonas_salina.1